MLYGSFEKFFWGYIPVRKPLLSPKFFSKIRGLYLVPGTPFKTKIKKSYILPGTKYWELPVLKT
jgi:hypothetical protein